MPGDQHASAGDGAAFLTATGRGPEPGPLERYRRLQRQLRRQFQPFTHAVCPGCPTPCCRKPAAVTPFDVALAEELGYQLPAGSEAAAGAVAVSLGLIPVPTLTTEGEPCGFLGRRGCRFPADLMPCGCVTFLCPYMDHWFSEAQMADLRAQTAELKEAYGALRAALLAEP